MKKQISILVIMASLTFGACGVEKENIELQPSSKSVVLQDNTPAIVTLDTGVHHQGGVANLHAQDQSTVNDFPGNDGRNRNQDLRMDVNMTDQESGVKKLQLFMTSLVECRNADGSIAKPRTRSRLLHEVSYNKSFRQTITRVSMLNGGSSFQRLGLESYYEQQRSFRVVDYMNFLKDSARFCGDRSFVKMKSYFSTLVTNGTDVLQKNHFTNFYIFSYPRGEFANELGVVCANGAGCVPSQ